MHASISQQGLADALQPLQAEAETAADTTPVQEIISTLDKSHPEERRLYWEDYISQNLIKIDCPVEPEEGLTASLQQSHFGDLKVNRIKANEHSIQRSLGHIKGDHRESIFLCQMLAGAGFSYQGTTCVHHSPGDIVLYDTCKPYGQGFPGDMEMIVVDIPRAVLGDYLGEWKYNDLVKIDKDTDLFDYSASGIYQALTQPCHTDGERAQAAQRLLENLYGILERRHSNSKNRSLMHILHQCKSYIHNHLNDENLSGEQVSHSLNISRRQLARAFELEGISVNRYIWNLRLDKCREDLLSGRANNLSVSDITFKWGFNHSAHFSRLYKTRFNETATQTRQLKQ